MTTMQVGPMPGPAVRHGAAPPHHSDARGADMRSGDMRDADMSGGGASGNDLAERVRGGDSAALTELFREHGQRIYNYCGRRTDWTDADDLTSEVFLTAVRVSAKAPAVDEALLPWLYAIAVNVVRNHARSRRRGSAALARMAPADDQDDFSDELVASLDADARLRVALSRLAQFPTSFQDAFHLVVWEGLSYDEAAAALDCPVGTIRSRISRVRSALRLTDEVAR